MVFFLIFLLFSCNKTSNSGFDSAYDRTKPTVTVTSSKATVSDQPTHLDQISDDPSKEQVPPATLPPDCNTPGTSLKTVQKAVPEIGKMTLLWVIDNSGSMKPYQEALTNNFRSFADVLEKFKIPFNLAVTTTSICLADNLTERQLSSLGRIRLIGLNRDCQTDTFKTDGLVGPILTQENPNLKELFTMQARVGTLGSSNEMGLSTSLRVLENNRSLTAESGFVSIIVLSDERDYSSELSPDLVKTYREMSAKYSDAEDWIQRMNRLFPEMNYAMFLITKPEFANEGKSATSVLDGYMQVVQKTGGSTLNINDPNWGSILEELATTITKKAARIPLNDANLLEVTSVSDGTTPITGWTLDPSNSLIFDSLLPKGTTLEITYKVSSPADPSCSVSK